MKKEQPAFIAVDCGKFETKVCALVDGKFSNFKYRTKIGKGDMADDMLKRATVVAQVNGGDVLSYGYGAEAEPEMTGSKQAEVHRIGTLTSIAMALGPGSHTNVCVAIGMPLDLTSNVAERLAYKDYILGQDGVTHLVKWKKDSSGLVNETSFTISKRFVYPEGCGALWVYPERLRGEACIVDIGNLNTNCVYAEGLLPEDRMCFTGELGGKALIMGISQALQGALGTRVTESMIASALAKPEGERKLKSAKGDTALEERSGQIIGDCALEHARMIRQQCDIHHWPLDFASVMCVGGTARLISRELAQVFGQEVFLPDKAEYVNAHGFLRRMCASMNVDIGERDGI